MTSDTETKLTDYDDLPQAVKDVMDRAVRKSRQKYWCDIFDKFSPEIFGVSKNHVVDSDGFSCRGYDKNGFNSEGYNIEGYNQEGRDSNGRDIEGRDIEGYDRRGFNKEGFNKEGRDKYSYDRNGYDREGYDGYGCRSRSDRAWYAFQAARPATDFVFDRGGNPRPKKKNIGEGF
jgi:hypothetical protein